MIVLDLVQNIALLVALAGGFRILYSRMEKDTAWRRVLSGLLFGGVALLGMATPVRLVPGLIFDGRSIILGIAGLFGGPLVAGVAAAMAGAYRVSLGGVGTLMGVAVIGEAALVGVLFHGRYRRSRRRPGFLDLWLFGFLIHAIMAALLLTLPGPARDLAWSQVGIPILLVYPLATMLVARLFQDYEEQHEARSALQESEARYRTTWRSIGDGVIATDDEGRVDLINPVAEALTGWTAQEALGRPLSDVYRTVDEATGRQRQDRVEVARQGSTPGAAAEPALLVSRDGSRRHVADSVAPIRDVGGAVTGVVVAFRDQSVDRETRRALEESRERMDLALRGADLGTWDWNIGTGAVTFDRRWARMVGYEVSELEPTLATLERLVHPDDLPFVREALEAHLEGRAPSYETEHRLLHKDGHWVWVLDRGRILAHDEGGRPVRASGTHLDISERRSVIEEMESRHAVLWAQNEALMGLMSSGAVFDTDPRASVRRIAEACASLVQADWVGYWRHTGGGTFHCFGAFLRSTREHSDGTDVHSSVAPAFVTEFQAGHTVVVRDVRTDPRTQDVPGDSWDVRGIRALVAAPVWVKGQVGGYLSFEHVGEPRDWSAAEERLAAIMATLVSLAVEGAERGRVEADLRKSLAVAERSRAALLSAMEDARAAELETRRALERLRRAESHAKLGHWGFAPESRAAWLSEQCFRLYHIQPRSEPPPFEEILEWTHPEDRRVVTEQADCLARGEIPAVRLIRTNPEYGPVRYLTARHSFITDTLTGMTMAEGTLMDVTDLVEVQEELRESEANLRLFIDHAPAALAMFDRDMRYMAASRRWLSDYGVDGEVVGRHHYEIFPDLPEPWKEVLRRGLAGEVVKAEEDRFQRADGRVHWLHWEVRPWYTADGRVGGIVISTEDITDRRRAELEVRALAESLEEKIQQRTRELKEANAELESFSYSVSHDLKAPLRAIDGYSAMLQEKMDGWLDPDGIRIVGEVRSSAQFMGRLIEDLLAFSRAGRASMNLEAIPVGPIVSDLLEAERSLAPDRIIDVEADGLPSVMADAVLLRQALANVLGNAVKFTRPRERATIRVTAEPVGGMVRLSIRDNGVGFDTRFRHKLFSVFERLHYADEFEGTGVGLAIVKRIMERHRGEVGIESEEGVGTVVHLTLPAGAEET